MQKNFSVNWARALRNFHLPCPKPKNFQNIVLKMHQIIGLPGAPTRLALGLVTCLGNICILCTSDFPSISLQCVVPCCLCVVL